MPLAADRFRRSDAHASWRMFSSGQCPDPGDKKPTPGEIRGPYPSERYAGIPSFSTSAYTTWEAEKVTQDPAGCFGGPRSEPPLPEDTRDYYSMRLSGSPPFACLQLREVYYRVLYPARVVGEMCRRPDAT